jgi:predicted metal-dependent peptidase
MTAQNKRYTMSVKSTASKAKKNWAPKELSQDELERMRAEVQERIIVARVGLLMRHPFFGNMATRLKIQAADDWCPTAATDGRNLYYNTQFFHAMSNKEVEFVIAHEILHCVYDHFSRREHRNPKLYNIAADYIVNNLLVRDRIGLKPKLIDCFQDFKYEGWSSEEVYDELYKNADKIDIDKLGELLDEHIDWESDSDEDGNGNGQGSGRPRLSKEDLDAIRDEIKEAMIQAASAAGAGNTPAGIQRLIKEMTEPKMNWRELLRQQIQSTIRSDYTFARPSRKGWHSGAILPGMNFADTIDICISLDMSGSIGNDQAADFLGEIQGIMDEFKDYKIKLWCFDTKVYNEQDFSADGTDSLTEYEIMGGGGTDFDANWTYMKENDIQPKKFIMFTDMYPWDSWGDPDYCDTIFINHGRPGFEAPFGITAEYDPNK